MTLAFLASLALLAAGSTAAASCVRSSATRFWVALTAALAQVWTASLLASFAGGYTPGGVLLAQAGLVAALVAIARTLRRGREGRTAAPPPAVPASPWKHDPVALGALAVTAIILGLSGVRQALTPLGGIDELNYHASRALYWIQNQSVLPYETHNERQTAFPFAAEMLFSWAVLFTRAEAAGRLVHWLAFPLGAAGMHVVARELGARRAAAAVGALLYVATPAALRLAFGLKSDAWTPPLALGVAYWALRAHAGHRPAASFLAAGFTLALGAGVKTTLLAMAPGLAALTLLAGSAQRIGGAIAAATTGALAGAAASGLAVLLIANTLSYGHPLGPANLRYLVQPEGGMTTMLIHIARAPIYLLELPDIPAESVRQTLENAKRQLAAAIGADRPLAGEDRPSWPGPFRVQMPRMASAYSLAGLLWIPTLLLLSVRAIRDVIKSWRSPRLSGGSVVTILQVPLLLGAIFMIRWMGGGPDRFWMPAFALFIPVVTAAVDRLTRRSTIGLVALLILVPYAVYPQLRIQPVEVERAAQDPHGPKGHHGRQYAKGAAAIGRHARVLLVGHSAAADYLLFDPAHGYTNHVTQWGRGEFDAHRLERLVSDSNITHIVVADRFRVGFVSGRSILAAPFIEWLDRDEQFQRVPIDGVALVLFRRTAPSSTE